MPRTIRVTLAALGVLLFIYGIFGLTPLFTVWGLGFYLVATIGGLIIWREGLMQSRALHDLATSRIASAAQGYVELIGQAVPITDAEELISPEGRRCLWYERRITGQRSHGLGPLATDVPVLEVQRSNQPLLIDDGTGQALLLPEHADVLGAHTTARVSGETLIKESIICAGDPLYVVGEFRTEHPSFDWHRCVNELISHWEQDTAARQRFDLNGDGKLDLEELLALDTEARAEADRRHAAALAEPGTHTVRDPRDGRRFVIAARSVEALDNESFFWAALGLTLFIIFGLISAAIITSRFV